MESNTNEEIKTEIVPASSPAGASGKTKIVRRNLRSGLFQRKAKPPTPAEAQRAIASKLTEPLDETGKSHAEEVLDAQLTIAKMTNVADIGTSSTKAAEFVFKAAGMLAPNPAPQQEKPLQIVLSIPILYDKDGNERPIERDEDKYVKPSKPSWLLDGKSDGKQPPTIEATFTEDKKS
jgi:hypothetical protein